MKRKPLWCVTASAIILASLLAGCDALDSAMDTMSKNVYEEVGFVSADTSVADEVMGKVNKLDVSKVYVLSNVDNVKEIAAKYGYDPKTATKTEAVFTQLNKKLEDEGSKSWNVLDPQSEPDATALTESLSKALASESTKKDLIKQLDKPAVGDYQKAAEDSLKLLDAVAEAVKTDEVWKAMGIADDPSIKSVVATVLDSLTPGKGEITWGDVLVLQMTTNVISRAVSSYVKQESTGEKTMTPVQIAETMLSGVQNVQNIAGELSGKTSGFFDFKVGDLLKKLN